MWTGVRPIITRTLLLSIVFSFPSTGAAVAAANQPAPRTFTAVRLPDGVRPLIDGRVDEEVWLGVEPMSDFTQQDPVEGAPATERTEVRVLYDRQHLYVGIICFDREPDKILVTQSRRDAQLTDTDSVQIVLDTFNDSQNAFVFGTNPLGIEYDGQVAGEGRTGALTFQQAGARGSQRGQVSGVNPNWDGDWTVRAQITERGWEAELAIPFKTLRYRAGPDRTWGFNVMRNIRRKNEQVYLAPIPRGYDLYRVSLAAKLTGLDLPPRREIKVIPFAVASANQDATVSQSRVERRGDAGLDLKWGIRPNLTADFTVNTDFAQVEADEEQVNLTRFDLFFPEKRPFFLENASIFQFGQPQQIDLFFSRRIGLAGTGASGLPIGIIGGARLTGKIGPYNVGLLSIGTEKTTARPTGLLVAPTTWFNVARLQREVGRSNLGAIFVGRRGLGPEAAAARLNRAYGVDTAWQVTTNSRLFAFLARTDTPDRLGSDYAGRLFYTFTNDVWSVSVGFAQVGARFNPEVGFLPRRGYRSPEWRVFYTPQPKRWPWIRRFAPHTNYYGYFSLDNRLQTSRAHLHFFELQPAQGGRFGFYLDRHLDAPDQPFAVYAPPGARRVVVPPGRYGWNQWAFEYLHNPSAALSGTARYWIGGFYDGDLRGVDLEGTVRVGAHFSSTVGLTQRSIDLPYGRFATTLVPVKVSYSFTTLASLQALVQYNSQTAQVSSNIRLALLDRSGTGLFVVYNDRRETARLTPEDLLGRSFIVKYTRLIDF
jgi:hypothetical protein